MANANGLLHINVIQRTSHQPRRWQTLFRQWDMARDAGLVSTTLVTRPILLDAAACDRLREQWQGSDDELGLSFHDFQTPEFAEMYGSREKAGWLLPQAVRGPMFAEMVELFERRFGRPPAAVGDYVMDVWSLRHLEAHHRSVKVAVTNCFEEGVNMFRGNNHNWHLFSDGGPWGPFFPSRGHALAPAHDAADAIDIVAVPHLNRDMVMAISSRDDLFASHPLNLVRARVNQGGECPYHFRTIEQWADQAALNGWDYYNIFVSTGWLSGAHWAVVDPAAGDKLYVDTLRAFRRLEDEGRGKVSTMSGFSDAFRAMEPAGKPHLCHWQDVLRPNPRRQVVWVVNSHYRAALDLNLGGVIVDLRAYDGRVDGELGPDGRLLANGNYPFLIASEHRGGFWNSGQSAMLEVDGQPVALWDCNRVRARVERAGAGWVIEADPVVADFEGGRARVVSRWHCDGSGTIRLERRIIECTKPDARLAVTEWFGGSLGTTEYPDDMRGVVLAAHDRKGGERARLPFAYASGERVVEGAASVSAEVPQIGVAVELQAPDGDGRAELADGTVFSPYFHLRLTRPASVGRPVNTLLKLRGLP